MNSACAKTNRTGMVLRVVSLAALTVALLPGSASSIELQRDVAFAATAPENVRSAAFFVPASVAPDDFEDDRTAPQAVSDATLPLAQNRTIHAATVDADWDYYRLTGTAGTLYTFETTGTADTLLEVRNAVTNELLAWYDDKRDGSSGSKGYWRCPSAGARVLVRVGPANSARGRGGYSMSITGVPGARRAGAVERVYGTSRYAGAVRIASDAYQSASGSPWHYYTQAGQQKNVSRVIVTSGDSAAYYVPMIAQPLARIYNAPVLLVGKHSLPASTLDAIKAIRSNNGGSVSVYVIGSTGHVSSGVYSRLKSLKGAGGTIERISAADRYGLSAKIADRVDAAWVRDMGQHATRVIVANGSRSSARTDLLAASGIAYRMGWPMLLTKTSSVPSAIRSRIRSGKFRHSRVTVANSRTYVTPAAYRRVSGDSRLSAHSGRADSTLDIARKSIGNHWLTAGEVVVVNKVEEALTAGTYAGERGATVLVSATDGPSSATRGYFLARPSMVDSVAVVGSSGSVSSTGVTALSDLVR